MSALEAGAVLADRYQLVESLGAGGMGAVFRAHDRALSAPVAVKFLRPDVKHSERALARFVNEVKLARMVTHPNVCRIHDVVDADGWLFITMEYVEGDSLDLLLAREPRPSFGKITQILTDVASGTAAAHAVGVVHRDLKPANVAITPSGKAVILDFGIAAHDDTQGLTGEGHVVGTPAYMAPEQLEHGRADARSDVYALGLLAYEMLAGKPPLLGDTHVATAVRRSREEAPPIEGLRPDTPETLARFVTACLKRVPADRPRDAAAALALLDASRPSPPQQASRTQAETAPEVPIPSPAPPAAGHRRARRAWLIAAAAIVVASSGVLLRRAIRPAAIAGPRLSAFAIEAPRVDSQVGRGLQRLCIAELADVWGIEVQPAETGAPGAIAGRVTGDASTLRVELRFETGETIVLVGSSVLDLASSVARAVAERNPARVTRPSAADLAASGTDDLEAWRLWRSARRAGHAHSIDRTRALARQTVARAPRFPLAHLELASTFDEGEHEATRAIQAAAGLTAGLAEPWRLEIEVYRAWLTGGGETEIITPARKLAELTPDDLYVQVRYAVMLIEMARVDDGLARLEQLARNRPDDVAAPRALAQFYLGRQYHAGALATRPTRTVSAAKGLEWAMRSVKAGPADASAHATLALAHLLSSDQSKAQDEAEVALWLDPASRYAIAALYTIHMARGDFRAAAEVARRLLDERGDPRLQADGAYLLGLVDLSTGQFDRGLQRLIDSAHRLEQEKAGFRAATYYAAHAWYALQLQDLEAASLSFAAADGLAHTAFGIYGDRAVFKAAIQRRRAPVIDHRPLSALAREALAEHRKRDWPDELSMPFSLALFAAHEDQDWRAALDIFRRLKGAGTAGTGMQFLAADALEHLDRPDEARQLYQGMVRDPYAWQEPIQLTRAWLRSAALAERADDRADALRCYREVMRRWEDATREMPEFRAAHDRAAVLMRSGIK